MTLLDRQKELATWLATGYPDLYLPALPLVSAAAAVGNATQESSCEPVTTGPKDHGSDGLFQWRLGRLTLMQSWCTQHFGGWETIRAQAAYFLRELRDGEDGANLAQYHVLYHDLLAGSKSLATLTTDINRYYERSADSEALNNRRIKYANDIYAAMLGKPMVKAPAVVATTAVVVGGGAMSWFLNHSFSAMDFLIISGLLNAGLVYLVYKLHFYLPSVLPTPAPALPSLEDKYRSAIAEKQAAATALANASKDVTTQQAAMEKFVADMEARLKTIEGTTP